MPKLVFLIFVFLFSNLSAAEKVSLQLKWKHSFQFAGFYMAKEKGFYKDTGLNVTLKELESQTDLVKSMVSGESNYGIGDSALIYYKLKKQPIVLMMPVLETSPLAILTTKDINSLTDFKSDSILINEFSLKSPAVLSMLYISNIDINKLKPQIGVFTVNDIEKQKLDLYAVYTPNQPYFLKKHHIKYRLFSPADYGLDFYGDILFTSQNEIDNHFERSVRFMDASKRGWEYALSHIDETIQVIQEKYNSQHYSKEELLYQAHSYQKLITKNYKFNRHKIETIKIIFQLLYKIDNNFNYNDFVLNRFIATKSGRDFLKQHIIKCITTTNWAPFNLLNNGKTVGLSIDYWNIIADKLHIDNSCYKTDSFSQVLEDIKTKKADLTISTSETPDRKEYAVFSKSYVTFPVAVAAKKGAEYTPDIDAIKNKTFALAKNHTATKLLLEKVPNLKYIETNNLEESLKLVESGKADATVEILPVLAYTINNKNFDNLEISGETELQFPVKFMIREDYKELLPMINRVIDSIDEQTRKKIYDRWISVNMKTGYSKHQINRLILIGTLALLFFVLWVSILIYQIKKKKKSEATLQKLADYDKLTSIYNRYKIDNFLVKHIKMAKHHKRSLTIIFFDIDKFKAINDTYGHKRGDIVLQEIASLVSINIRQSDIFGRWGGEEFLIILHKTDLQSANILAEKLRKKIETYNFTEVGRVTCSFGVIEVDTKDSIDEMIKKVDKMLYLAKKRGRNRVVSNLNL